MMDLAGDWYFVQVGDLDPGARQFRFLTTRWAARFR